MLGCVVLGLLGLGWVSLDLHQGLLRTVKATDTPLLGRRIDPATATLPEWTLIPGIGPAVAGRIDRARRAGRLGPLGDVPGVGPITLRDAAPYLIHPRVESRNRSSIR